MAVAEMHEWRGYEPTYGLSGLSDEELAQRLKDHAERCGVFLAPSDLEIAREGLRRARLAKAAAGDARVRNSVSAWRRDWSLPAASIQMRFVAMPV